MNYSRLYEAANRLFLSVSEDFEVLISSYSDGGMSARKVRK